MNIRLIKLSDEDGLSILDKEYDGIVAIDDIKPKFIEIDILRKISSYSRYCLSNHSMLVKVSDGWLFMPRCFGVDNDVAASCIWEYFQLSGCHSRDVQVRPNDWYTLNSGTYDKDTDIISVHATGQQINLDSSTWQVLYLQLEDFIRLMFTGSLKIQSHMKNHPESGGFSVTVMSAVCPKYILLDSGDIFFSTDIADYLKMFTCDQYKHAGDVIVSFVKYLCNDMFVTSKFEITHTRILRQCPLLASVLLEICWKSRYHCLQYLGKTLKITKEVSGCFRMRGYERLSDFWGSDAEHYEDMLQELIDAAVYSDVDRLDWELEFLSYIESTITCINMKVAGFTRTLLGYKQDFPDRDICILKKMVKLIYRQDGLAVIKEWNRCNVLSALALYLKLCFPGTLYLVDDDYLAFADTNGVFYAGHISKIGNHVKVEIKDCDFAREVEFLYHSADNTATCGILGLISTNFDTNCITVIED